MTVPTNARQVRSCDAPEPKLPLRGRNSSGSSCPSGALSPPRCEKTKRTRFMAFTDLFVNVTHSLGVPGFQVNDFVISMPDAGCCRNEPAISGVAGPNTACE